MVDLLSDWFCKSSSVKMPGWLAACLTGMIKSIQVSACQMWQLALTKYRLVLTAMLTHANSFRFCMTCILLSNSETIASDSLTALMWLISVCWSMTVANLLCSCDFNSMKKTTICCGITVFLGLLGLAVLKYLLSWEIWKKNNHFV